jgi:hypothetical protein
VGSGTPLIGCVGVDAPVATKLGVAVAESESVIDPVPVVALLSVPVPVEVSTSVELPGLAETGTTSAGGAGGVTTGAGIAIAGGGAPIVSPKLVLPDVVPM